MRIPFRFAGAGFSPQTLNYKILGVFPNVKAQNEGKRLLALGEPPYSLSTKGLARSAPLPLGRPAFRSPGL